MKAVILLLALLAMISNAYSTPIIIYTQKRQSSPSGFTTTREWIAEIKDLMAGPEWNGQGEAPFDKVEFERIARDVFVALYPNCLPKELKSHRIQNVGGMKDYYAWFHIYTFDYSAPSSRPGWMAEPPSPVLLLSNGKPVLGYIKK
jgi:hypothetical protein